VVVRLQDVLPLFIWFYICGGTASRRATAFLLVLYLW